MRETDPIQPLPALQGFGGVSREECGASQPVSALNHDPQVLHVSYIPTFLFETLLAAPPPIISHLYFNSPASCSIILSLEEAVWSAPPIIWSM